jgi:hypothetical protein
MSTRTAERALHNVADSPWAPRPRELRSDEVAAGVAAQTLVRLVERVKAERCVIYFVRPDRKRTRACALVPADLALAIEAAGGPDAAVRLLLSQS